MGHKKTEHEQAQELYQALLSLKTAGELEKFLRDLCTPQEITALIDRWQICQLLQAGDLSYRAISETTGASLATITRVARFLKDEPYQGYTLALKRTKIQKL